MQHPEKKPAQRKLTDYAELISNREIEQIQHLAESLHNKKIQQINSARTGGGVAEMLQSLIVLEQSLGLDVSWDVISAGQDFFVYTKTMHNFLQGNANYPDIIGTKVYWDTNKNNRDVVRQDADLVLIHDPQPAGLIEFMPPAVRQRQKWLWRCHIHLSLDENKDDRGRDCMPSLYFLQSLIERYDTAIFSSGKFLPPWQVPAALILPYIDPLSDKNRDLSQDEMEAICNRFGLDPDDNRMVLMVSRFDPFKGHQYALEAFKLIRKEVPCKLLMVGGTASDDPENEIIYKHLLQMVSGDPDIELLNLPPDSHVEINALQRAASVILQPSLKEGFGLTVSEGLWKGKPVIAGDVGGIPAQITDGYNGFLVTPGEKGVKEMADRMRYLFNNPAQAREMGERGRKAVRERFLVTRGLADELRLFAGMLAGK